MQDKCPQCQAALTSISGSVSHYFSMPDVLYNRDNDTLTDKFLRVVGIEPDDPPLMYGIKGCVVVLFALALGYDLLFGINDVRQPKRE